jgi:hypothetical protein
MQDISCLVLPIPAHAFFKQAVLQGEIGHDLLQGGGLTTKVLEQLSQHYLRDGVDSDDDADRSVVRRQLPVD